MDHVDHGAPAPVFLGVDVGTTSARAGLYTQAGVLLATAETPIILRRRVVARRRHVSPTRDEDVDENVGSCHVAEYSAEQIWSAVCESVRCCVSKVVCKEPDLSGNIFVAGIAFDATCSLVAVQIRHREGQRGGDEEGRKGKEGDEGQEGPAVVLEQDEFRPVSVSSSTSGQEQGGGGVPVPPGVAPGVRGHGTSRTYDTIAWLCHRAEEEAEEINSWGRSVHHPVLDFVGGAFSPEMQLPKLLWLKRHRPELFDVRRDEEGAVHRTCFFDLCDYLVFRATGRSDVRSLCPLVCKWGYMIPERLKSRQENREGGRNAADKHADQVPGCWPTDLLEYFGLGDLPSRVGGSVLDVGAVAGMLTESARRDMGLLRFSPPQAPPGRRPRPGGPGGEIKVVSGIIDAHCGMLGVLGMHGAHCDEHEDELENTLPLCIIAGTSSCLMICPPGDDPCYVSGVWGPYYGAALPGLWLAEGGISAAGAAVDFFIARHPDRGKLQELAERWQQTPIAVLNQVYHATNRILEKIWFRTRNPQILWLFRHAGNRGLSVVSAMLNFSGHCRSATLWIAESRRRNRKSNSEKKNPKMRRTSK